MYGILSRREISSCCERVLRKYIKNLCCRALCVTLHSVWRAEKCAPICWLIVMDQSDPCPVINLSLELLNSAQIKVFTEINKPVWLAAEVCQLSLSVYYSPSMTIPNTSFSSMSINLRPRSVSYHPSFRYRFFPVSSLCHILFSKC